MDIVMPYSSGVEEKAAQNENTQVQYNKDTI